MRACEPGERMRRHAARVALRALVVSLFRLALLIGIIRVVVWTVRRLGQRGIEEDL